MGDETPDPVQIQCPGCESRFKLTPKKGRLPSGDVPCPKCFEEIPVEDGEVVTDGEDDQEQDQDQEQERSDSAPGFGVVSPPDQSDDAEDSDPDGSTDQLDAEEQRAVEELEEMADELEAAESNSGSSGSKSTMAGLPGVGRNPGENPFTKDSSNQTAAVDEDTMRRVADQSSSTEDDEESSSDDSARSSFDRDSLPDTSPRLVDEDHAEQLAAGDSTAAESGDGIPEPDTDTRELRDTAEHPSPEQNLRETAENPSVPGEKIKASLSDADDGQSDDSSAPGAGVLGKIEKKQIPKSQIDSSEDDQDDGSTDGPDLPRPDSSDDVPETRQNRSTAEVQPAVPDGDTDRDEAGDEEDDDSSLSNLFKKVRERRGSDEGNLREKLESATDTDDSEDADEELADLADEVDLSEDELEELVDQTDDEESEDSGEPDGPELPTPAASQQSRKTPKSDLPAPKTAGTSDSGDEQSGDDHSGLFEDVESPADDAEAPESAVQDVSDEAGDRRTQSAIARLKKDGDDAVDIGAAGEKRGSGYIRLPTDEIQDVLGQGDFRLKIDGVVYEPVDKEGLIKLIKGGVLLGAEEIAEAGGDWMPISDHPVFGELRRKMADEAHNVLSQLGARDRPAEDDQSETEDDQPGQSDDEPPTTLQSHAVSPEDADVSSGDPPDAQSEDDDSEAPAVLQSRSPDRRPAARPESTADTDDSTPSEPQAAEPADADGPSEPPEPADDSTPDRPEAEPTETPDDEPDSPPTPESTAPAGDDEIVDSGPQAPPIPDEPADEPPPPDSSDQDSETFAELDSTPEGLDESSTDAVADAPPADPPSSTDKPVALIVGALLGVTLLAAGGLLLTEPGQDILDDTVGWSPADEPVEHPEDDPADEPEVPEQLREALAAAENDVVDALPDDPDAAENDDWIDEYLQEGQLDRATDVMRGQFEEGRRDRDFLQRFSETLHENGDYDQARTIALAGITEYPDDELLFDIHRRAVEDDERLFTYEFAELRDPAGYRADGVYDVADHRGVILEDGDRRLLFKPRRDDWDRQWRAEIASARFCELVACHFEVLDIEPAVVTRDFFEGLEAAGEAVDRLAADATWETVSIEDRQVEAVRGTLEQLPDTDAPAFPIEYRPLWRDWLTAGEDTGFVDVPLTETLGTLEELDDDGRFRRNLTEAAGGVPTGQVARSVSSLLMFDYLTNNWERFATRTEEYGRNNPVYGDSLLSRHNGHAFQPRASRRVRGRFEWTSRFSQSTVETIRALDRETTYDVLFPDRRTGEERRLDVMWDQRSDMLDRVDELVGRHGEDEVLLFD